MLHLDRLQGDCAIAPKKFAGQAKGEANAPQRRAAREMATGPS